MKQIQTVELYKGEIKIDFHYDDEDPKVHYYTKAGDKKRLLGVTTVTGIMNKPALIPWAVNLAVDHIAELVRLGVTITPQHLEDARMKHRVQAAKAASIGTKVHEWAERYIGNQNQELPEDANVRNGVMGFLQWVDEHKIKFISSERIVYSKKHGYVGTLDAEAYIDGKRCVVDFKTGSAVYNEMRYQVAAYRNAAEEEGTIFDTDSVLARFDKETGNFEHHILKDHIKDYRVFKGLLAAKKREQELNKK